METDHKPLVPHSSAGLISTPCQRESCTLGCTYPGLTIPSAMSQGSFSTPVPVHQLPPPAANVQTEFFASVLVSTLQPVQTILMSTAQLSKKTVPAISLSPSVSRGGLTDASSRGTYRHTGKYKESSPSTTTFSCMAIISLSQEPASYNTAEGLQWASGHPQMPPLCCLSSMVAWDVQGR